MSDYAFPVELEKVYLKSGVELPALRSVVRQDTGMPIANVSDKYRLVKHGFVMDSAEKFVTVFGRPERRFHLGRNGARLVGEFAYREKSNLAQVRKGDVVGLKVFVENSYNTESAVRVQIGATVLSCLNGMVVQKSIFSYSYRHVLGDKEIKFPEPGFVYDTYQDQAGVWRAYAERDLAGDDLNYESILTTAVAMDVITLGGRDRLLAKTADTYWDLMQNLTFEATHEGKISPIGRLMRMERIDRFVRGIADTGRLPFIEQPVPLQ